MAGLKLKGMTAEQMEAQLLNSTTTTTAPSTIGASSQELDDPDDPDEPPQPPSFRALNSEEKEDPDTDEEPTTQELFTGEKRLNFKIRCNSVCIC